MEGHTTTKTTAEGKSPPPPRARISSSELDSEGLYQQSPATTCGEGTSENSTTRRGLPPRPRPQHSESMSSEPRYGKPHDDVPVATSDEEVDIGIKSPQPKRQSQKTSYGYAILVLLLIAGGVFIGWKVFTIEQELRQEIEITKELAKDSREQELRQEIELLKELTKDSREQELRQEIELLKELTKEQNQKLETLLAQFQSKLGAQKERIDALAGEGLLEKIENEKQRIDIVAEDLNTLSNDTKARIETLERAKGKIDEDEIVKILRRAI